MILEEAALLSNVFFSPSLDSELCIFHYHIHSKYCAINKAEILCSARKAKISHSKSEGFKKLSLEIITNLNIISTFF